MVNNKITFVIAVSRASREDWEGHKINDLARVHMMLSPSLEKFVDRDSLHEVIYICPDNDLEHMESLKSSPLNIRLIPDSQLIDNSINFSSGWFKQQILKLKVSEHIETDHYILLDADMFATRHTSFSDLIVNGKAKIGTIPYHTHQDWWENTAEIMGYEIDYDLKERVPGCTPQILHTSLVKELMEHLCVKVFKDKNWVEELSKLCPNSAGDSKIRWTEYCLYWLFVIKEKGLYDYYNEGDTILVDKAVWDEDVYNNMEDNHLNLMFHPHSNHHFSVVQSNIRNTSVQEIYGRIQTYVGGASKSIGS